MPAGYSHGTRASTARSIVIGRVPRAHTSTPLCILPLARSEGEFDRLCSRVRLAQPALDIYFVERCRFEDVSYPPNLRCTEVA